jgi:hypothetical protein
VSQLPLCFSFDCGDLVFRRGTPIRGHVLLQHGLPAIMRLLLRLAWRVRGSGSLACPQIELDLRIARNATQHRFPFTLPEPSVEGGEAATLGWYTWLDAEGVLADRSCLTATCEVVLLPGAEDDLRWDYRRTPHHARGGEE